MNTVVVRCASCRQLSRVPAEAVGLEVACPRCPATFVALPDGASEPPLVQPAATVPVVRARPRPVQSSQPARAIQWDAPEPGPPPVEEHPTTGGLVALALLPFGIPLLWLLAAALTQREVLMSFAVPLAVAVGVSGLAFGTVTVRRWTVGARVKAVLALLFLGYFAAGFLFLVKKEWMEELERRLPFNLAWRNFHVKPSGKQIGYSVQFPANGPVTETDSPVPGWDWKAHRSTDPKRPGARVYLSASGPASGVGPWVVDALWFEAVGKAVKDAADATLKSEEAVTLTDRVVREQHSGREYHFTRADGWSRVVRVYKIRGQVVYLSVEGNFLTPDALDVKHFLESLHGPFQ